MRVFKTTILIDNSSFEVVFKGLYLGNILIDKTDLYNIYTINHYMTHTEGKS